MAATKDKPKPTSAKQRFRKLARAWKSETELISKVSKRVLHPAYQKIIGMGEAAVPFILQDLADNGSDDWFWALTAITDANPITAKIAGNMPAMTEAWLQWGRNASYLKSSPPILTAGWSPREPATIANGRQSGVIVKDETGADGGV
jgi:hypothetical protein